MSCSIPVALKACKSYDTPKLGEIVGSILDAAIAPPARGSHILVKPNLLTAKPLACTSPQVTSAVCAWLLDHRLKIIVADSPGFGTAASVARSIGLDEALKPFGLKISHFQKYAKIPAIVPQVSLHKPVWFRIACAALDADCIFSVARIKAHGQMRMTMSVKNCFGCVPGLRKALMHTLYGATHEAFAACIAAIWNLLPPVSAVCDGITAMHVTGPSKGQPFPLGLLGASASAPALDRIILQILKVDPASVPLDKALQIYGLNNIKLCFPLTQPEDFHIQGFEVPASLTSASFNPLRLIKSCIRRLWLNWRN